MGRGLLVRIRWFQLPNKERQRVRAQSGPPVKIWGMGTSLGTVQREGPGHCPRLLLQALGWSRWVGREQCSAAPALGSLWWAGELSLGQDYNTHPRPLQRTHNKDKGHDTRRRASPGRKGVFTGRA